MSENSTPLIYPKPRRPYDISTVSANASPLSTPSLNRSTSSFRLEPDSLEKPSNNRNRSILNLTSSTLFGIYTRSATDSVSGFESNRDLPSTPWGNGSQTPARVSIDDNRPPVIGAYLRPGLQRSQSSFHPPVSLWAKLVPLVSRTVLLFCFGVAHGVIVSHLHDHQQLAPVQLEGVELSSRRYLIGWGVVGVILGGLLPWVDMLWEEVLGTDKEVFSSKPKIEESRPEDLSPDADPRPASSSGTWLGADWNPVVRGIGAFIGIAFAVVSSQLPPSTTMIRLTMVQRRLPWQSTSQMSLTLALANPVLWYIVDRSKTGFLLSMLIALGGTAITFGINPAIVPSPPAPSSQAGLGNVSYDSWMYDGFMSNESIGVGTWIASVLFCSSVCFGNIGRRLALGTPGR